MTAPSVIRKRLWDGEKVDPRDLGEALRDIDARFASIGQTKVVEFDAPYTEPMFVALDSNPKGLLCIRVRDANNLPTAVLCGSMVDFQWDSGRAQVDSIDGLSPGSGVTYRFTFMAVF